MARMIPVGKCGDCGGVVSVPETWMGTQRPPKTCEGCGAIAEETAGLPTMPMKKSHRMMANCLCDRSGVQGTAICPIHGFIGSTSR